jgi:cation:H+ antiporter
MLAIWIKFAICASLIVIFGFRLSKTAGHIVSMGRLSEGLMGVLILAAITSFPEVWTSIATVTKIDAPDLGIGDLIGSIIFNIMIIAALDFKYGKAALLSSVKKYHLPTCGLSLMALGFAFTALALNVFTERRGGLFNIGIEGYFIFSIYIASLLINYKKAESKKKRDDKRGVLMKAYIQLCIYGAVIIVCGFWLASIAKEIVDIKGWDQMYFGTIAIAFTTSLPEIVVSLAAISIGSPNMAVANILGSNIFNMLIIPVMDIIYRKGYILNYVSSSHIYSCLLAIVLTLVVLYSIMYRPKRSFMRLGISTFILIFVFLSGNYLLYNIVHR